MKHNFCETCGHCVNCNPHPAANKETEKECSRCKWCDHEWDGFGRAKEED